MLRRIGGAGVLILFSALLAAAQTSTGTAELKIAGAVSVPLTLTVADLKNMPRTTLRAMNAHDKKEENYEGVLLGVLLQKAGAPHGEQLRSTFVDFLATTKCSVPWCRIRTFALVVQSTWSFSVGIDSEGPTFRVIASLKIRPPICRIPFRP